MLWQINLICVGKLKKKYLRNLEKKYLDNINLILVNENSVEVESNEIVDILNRYNNKFCVLFDLRGVILKKNNFRSLFRLDEFKNVFFIVGGSFGVSEYLVKNCDLVIKLSDFTYSHQIFRISSILFIKKVLFD